MDPFVRLTLGNQKFETTVAINQGKQPQWNQKFTITPQNIDEILFEAFDKDVGVAQPKFIGFAAMKISEIRKNKIM